MTTRALIFDFDGLIVDTETEIYNCWADFYREHGEELALSDYKQCVGSDFQHYDPGKELERRTGKTFDWDKEDFARNGEIRNRLGQKDARPGVRDFISKAVSSELPMAVASSSSRDWVEGWLEKLGLHVHFSGTRTRDDVTQIKPAPDLFLAAADLLEIDPAEALILEDSENGLRAATAAGIRCAIVTNPVTAGGDFTGAVIEAECFTDDRVQGLI